MRTVPVGHHQRAILRGIIADPIAAVLRRLAAYGQLLDGILVPAARIRIVHRKLLKQTLPLITLIQDGRQRFFAVLIQDRFRIPVFCFPVQTHRHFFLPVRRDVYPSFFHRDIRQGGIYHGKGISFVRLLFCYRIFIIFRYAGLCYRIVDQFSGIIVLGQIFKGMLPLAVPSGEEIPDLFQDARLPGQGDRSNLLAVLIHSRLAIRQERQRNLRRSCQSRLFVQPFLDHGDVDGLFQLVADIQPLCIRIVGSVRILGVGYLVVGIRKGRFLHPVSIELAIFIRLRQHGVGVGPGIAIFNPLRLLIYRIFKYTSCTLSL